MVIPFSGLQCSTAEGLHCTHTHIHTQAEDIGENSSAMEPVLPAGEEKQQLKSSFERDRNRSPKTRCQAKLHHTHTEIASKERGRQQERCGAQSGAFKSSSETNKWRPTWGLKEYDIKQRTSRAELSFAKHCQD